jgi:predicted enzyme related to lactoylglutathione lyase
MITGVHAIVFTPAADEVRAFFRDALGLPNVDAGGGWLIFALPPAELAVHPAEQPSHAIYLMTDDLDATIAQLAERGVGLARPITMQDWGRVTAIALPGGTELPLYEPSHRRPMPSPTT